MGATNLDQMLLCGSVLRPVYSEGAVELSPPKISHKRRTEGYSLAHKKLAPIFTAILALHAS